MPIKASIRIYMFILGILTVRMSIFNRLQYIRYILQYIRKYKLNT